MWRAHDGPANVTSTTADLNASVQCDQGESCTWYWEYWPASLLCSSSTKSEVFGPVGQTPPNVALNWHITGLDPGTRYRWVFCGSNDGGASYACVGPRGQFDSPTADPPGDFDTFTTAAGDWNAQPTPNPSGASGSQLSSVSCSSASSCLAVGSYTISAGTGVTLAEIWNETAWTIVPTPNPAGATSSQLSRVSCAAATSCVAVGAYQTGTGGPLTALAETWNGATWTIPSLPTPPGPRPASS